MFAIASLLVVLVVSLLITRIATVALVATGLSREAARFQARSALTGTGFTTSEAEFVVDHPVRRRVVMALMLVGNAGLVAAMAALILAFARAGGEEAWMRIGALLGGLLVLLVLVRSAWVDRRLTSVIGRLLNRYTDLELRDYVRLLDLAGDYAVTELKVDGDDWVAGKTLTEAALRDEGIVVLGIQRADGRWHGAPSGPTRMRAGDTLILYGRRRALEELDRRRAGDDGDAEHERALREQERIAREEASRAPATQL